MTQPLYHRDRFIQLKQADSRIRQAQHEVDAVYQELIGQLSERYFALLGAADNLDFARAELTALRRQLEETRQRFEVGLIAITDVEEAQAGYTCPWPKRSKPRTCRTMRVRPCMR